MKKEGELDFFYFLLNWMSPPATHTLTLAIYFSRSGEFRSWHVLNFDLIPLLEIPLAKRASWFFNSR